MPSDQTSSGTEKSNKKKWLIWFIIADVLVTFVIAGWLIFEYSGLFDSKKIDFRRVCTERALEMSGAAPESVDVDTVGEYMISDRKSYMTARLMIYGNDGLPKKKYVRCEYEHGEFSAKWTNASRNQ